MLLTTSCRLAEGLLGAGTGQGSCAAPPFRATSVNWPNGCPEFAPCCSEYGYCQTREAWKLGGTFRDCNEESNGLELPFQLLQAEYLEGVAGRLVASNQLLGITGNLEDIVKSFNRGSSKDDVTIAPEVLNDVFGDSNDLSIDENKLNDVFGATNKASDTGTEQNRILVVELESQNLKR